MKFIKKLLTNNNRYHPDHSDYRRVYLLNAVLLSFIIVTLFFSILNIFVKDNPPVVITQIIISFAGVLILLFVHKTNKIRVAAYSFLILLTFFCSIFAIQVENQYYAMAWICLAPPIAYFLLGKKEGRIFSILYVIYFIVFMVIGLKRWQPEDVFYSSMLNLMGAVIGLMLLISYYERSKQDIMQNYINKNKQLKSVNQQLSENKNRLQLILDSTAEAIYGIDMDGKCTFCNQSCINILGYDSEDDLLGNVMHDIIYKNSQNKTECMVIKKIFEGIKVHAVRDVFYKADGNPLDVEYYSYPQYLEDKLLGAVITFLDNTERGKNEEKIKYLSTHDALTGLLNRAGFSEKLFTCDVCENLPITIIFCDLNGLKLTNDIYGHRVGDEFIAKSAMVLQRVCRETDIIARWGGDEFVVFLPNTCEDSVQSIIKRINNLMSEESVRAIKLSMSIGCFTKVNKDENIERIIDNAENNMYKEKMLLRKQNGMEMIQSIISFLHDKSPQEKEHSYAVSKLCVQMGKKMNLSEPQIKKLEDIGFYHDIGKIILDEKLLQKGVVMSEEERSKKHLHSVVGYRILNLFDFTLDLAEGVYSHHERWNGSGYPKGLKGEEIPYLARIVAVAEHYDKITGDYTKSPLNNKQALRKIKGMSGVHFDPEITDIFIEMLSGKSHTV